MKEARAIIEERSKDKQKRAVKRQARDVKQPTTIPPDDWNDKLEDTRELLSDVEDCQDDDKPKSHVDAFQEIRDLLKDDDGPAPPTTTTSKAVKPAPPQQTDGSSKHE